MDVKESYRALGLEMGAPRHEVVSAYRSLMHKWHPDRVARSGSKKTIQEANRMCQVINEAYGNLKNIAPDVNFEASGPPKSRSGGTHYKPEPNRTEPKHRQRPSTASSSSPDSGGSRHENSPRNPEASRAEQERARSQSGSASRARPEPVPTKAPASFSFNPNFSHILSGAVALTIILALVITTSKNQPAHNSTSTRIQEPENVALERRVVTNTQTVSEEVPQKAVASKGAILVTTNRTNTTIEAVIISANGDTGARTIVGTKKGTYAWALEELGSGKYFLTARLAGWPEIHRTVSVESGQTTQLTVEFKAGALRLQSIPTGASVYSDEARIGRTPLLITDLPPGKRKFSMKYASWPLVSVTTTIADDGETSETVRIPHGRLVVESTPAGASILIDGKFFGRTPLTIEPFPVGTQQIELQAEDYVKSILSVSVEDKAALTIHPVLASSLKILEPNEALNSSWTDRQFVGRDYDIAPNFEPTNASKPKNGVVRNLSRPVLDSNWLGRKFRYSAAIKKYDSASGLIEFTDQTGEKSKYRVVAQLSAETRGDRNFSNRLLKGAVVEISGRLSEVEEPRWPLKTILFQISNAQAVR